MDDSQEFDPLEFQPLASGLSDEDIGELLKLIRTKTDEKILEICSKREDAEVTTGFLADGEAGEGQTFGLHSHLAGMENKDRNALDRVTPVMKMPAEGLSESDWNFDNVPDKGRVYRLLLLGICARVGVYSQCSPEMSGSKVEKHGEF